MTDEDPLADAERQMNEHLDDRARTLLFAVYCEVFTMRTYQHPQPGMRALPINTITDEEYEQGLARTLEKHPDLEGVEETLVAIRLNRGHAPGGLG